MRSPRPFTGLKSLVLVCVFSFAAFGASYLLAGQSETGRMGLPQDWSHHHVVFSSIHDLQTLVKVRQDPRLLHQWARFNSMRLNPAPRFAVPDPSDMERFGIDSRTDEDDQKKVDWSVSLGAVNSIIPRSQYPAKYSFDVNGTPSCTNATVNGKTVIGDYAVFPTAKGGSTTQATIVGYENLYSSQNGALPTGLCGSNGPTVKWAYYTGTTTGSQVLTSPVLSLDGTQVAFVALNPATVHVLTIGTMGANGASVITPALPGTGNNAVDAQVVLNTVGTSSRRDSFSSLFVDYQNGVGYVGDDAGRLHKLTGIFNGTPAEVTTGGWPIPVSGAALNSPVFDFVSGNIFLTDRAGNLSYVRETGSTIGACVSGAPPCLGTPSIAVSSGANAVDDAPVLDYVTQRVLSETAINGTNAQILQADTALGNVVRVNVGQADPANRNPLHNGTFDTNYFTNVASGFYYACGKTNDSSLHATLYRIGFNSAGVLNSTPDAATLQLARGVAQCSPLLDVFNSGTNTEWLFGSVSNRCGASTIIGGGCIMSFNLNGGFPSLGATAFFGLRNGTSGIIMDNVSTASQASSIYFTNEGTGACGDGIATGGCAIKLTQSLLK